MRSITKNTAALPKISEKTYALSESGTYVFTFPKRTNKHEIKEAIESQFKVSVSSVRTSINKGKPKRTVAKRRAPKPGQRKDVKKAYITLQGNDKIGIFEEGK